MGHPPQALAAHAEALLAAGADPAARSPDGTSAQAWAARFGLPDVAEMLRRRLGGDAPALAPQELFLAACAQGDEALARRMLADRPGLIGTLGPAQLRLLPELAAQGCGEAVRLMVRLGWPIGVAGGDWQASALNHAVFRGDAGLTRFLLEHGAHWQERHGFGDDVCGTLSWASCNAPVDGGDWPGCAQALAAHGLPVAGPDPRGSGGVVVEGRVLLFSEEVAQCLLDAAANLPG